MTNPGIPINETKKTSPFRYGIGMLGTSIPINMFKSFAAAFYVIQLGLDMELYSTVLLIYTFIDVIDNPIYGFLSDRTNTKWGRRRPWLLIGTPLMVVCFLLFFNVPAAIQSDKSKLYMYMLLTYLLTGTLDSLMNANYGALFPELFKDDSQRAKTNAIRQISQLVAMAISIALTPMVAEKIGYNYIIGKGRLGMILRKPYAFFIKYFKLLHAIIAVLVAFLLYRSFTLYNFFRAYVVDYSSALNELSPRTLLNMYSFIILLGIIILVIILLSVMIYKKKPKALYIYSLIVYILVMVLYWVTFPVLRDISASILDIRFSSALRDFFLIAVVLQAVSLILYIVRATGFDIKQFDFGSDLQKLDINEKDSEEIEVALEFDKNKVNRQVRYKIRQLKYIYIENKFLINTVGIILVVVLAFTIYLNIGVYTASYNQGSSFSASGVVMNIRDSYLTQTDPYGNQLTDDMIVAVKMDIKKDSLNKTLNTGLATLRIGDVSYGQNNNYAKELYDLGTAYVNQQLRRTVNKIIKLL